MGSSLESVSQPNFPLASWEVPPDCDVPLIAPADGIYQAVWQGEPANFLYRLVEIDGFRHTFIRLKDSAEVGNWVAMERGQTLRVPASLSLRVEVPYAETQSEMLDSIARLFYFDGKSLGYSGLHQLTVTGSGSCGLSCDQWLYTFSLDFDVSQWSTAQVGRHVKSRALSVRSDTGAILAFPTRQFETDAAVI